MKRVRNKVEQKELRTIPTTDQMETMNHMLFMCPLNQSHTIWGSCQNAMRAKENNMANEYGLPHSFGRV